MIYIKNQKEIENIRKACMYIEKILFHVKQLIKPNVSTKDIVLIISNVLKKNNLQSSLLREKAFPLPISISINNIAVHGGLVPQTISKGDVVTIDIAACYNGWNGDAAWTYAVPGKDDEKNRLLLRAAWRCTMAGIAAAVPGGYIRDIGAAIEEEASKCGCNVVPDFAGHGIGRNMHESPTIFHYGIKNTGEKIVPGMVFTIEPVVTFGNTETDKHNDGFAYVMRDGSKTAQFEHTIAVFGENARILSLGGRPFEKKLFELFE